MLYEVGGYSVDPSSDAESIFNAVGLVSTRYWTSYRVGVWVR